VAVAAAVRLRVHMQGALAALKLIRMAITAHIAGYSLEEPFLAAYMGTVTGDTP